MIDAMDEFVAKVNLQLQRGVHKIDRLRLDEFQIIVGTDVFEVACRTCVDLRRSGNDVLSMEADHRLRTDDSFAVGRIVGRRIGSCNFRIGE